MNKIRVRNKILALSGLFLLQGCNMGKSSSPDLASSYKPHSSDIDLPDGTKFFHDHDSMTDQRLSGLGKYYEGLMPSKGNVKVLTFLIDFPDHPASASDISKEELEKGFFGSSSDTGWQSLTSFYQNSSNGQLNISGDIFGWYTAPNNTSYYNSDNNVDSGGYEVPKTRELIKSILNHYNSQIDYSKYDADGDGFIDALYFVYSRPFSTSSTSNFWAYQYIYGGNDKFDGKNANGFIWISSSFFDSSETNSEIPGIDSETLIHETGHLLGLNDYYDYNNLTSGLGGADMMDYNIGDHGPFNKILLDWIDPIYFDGSQSTVTIDLRPASAHGDVIMLAPSFNNTIFDEYFLIDYYRPEGLLTRNSKYFSTPGIRIYHVDATLSYDSRFKYYDFEYSNTTTAFSKKRLIEYVENGAIQALAWPSQDAKSSMLYRQDDNFGITQWDNYAWNRTKNAGYKFTMEVVELTSEKATLVFNLNL